MVLFIGMRLRMANQDDRDAFGIVVTYVVKLRLFLGALAGELVGELPIILMHPKVNNLLVCITRKGTGTTF